MEVAYILIIDEKIISPILVQMAFDHHIPIYYTDDERSLALTQSTKLLTNSESCLSLLERKAPDHAHSKASQLVKNKARFREISASINQDYFFRLLSLEELLHLEKDTVPFPVVIKPNKGYSSVGVYIVKNEHEWEQAVQGLYSDLLLSEGMYSDTVIDSEQIIIEEWIDGTEFALDCYFDDAGEPVILNALKRRFLDDQDTSDRIYFTSAQVIDEIHADAVKYLRSLNKRLNFTNYPFHIEIRKSTKGIVPIEMNPLRFAGAGTTDVSYYAYDINAAEAYFLNEQPDWKPLIERNDPAIYGFFCAEVPTQISKSLIEDIHHEQLKQEFSEVLEYRVIDSASDRAFAVIFFKTTSLAEIDYLVNLDLESYIELKKVKETIK